MKPMTEYPKTCVMLNILEGSRQPGKTTIAVKRTGRQVQWDDPFPRKTTFGYFMYNNISPYWKDFSNNHVYVQLSFHIHLQLFVAFIAKIYWIIIWTIIFFFEKDILIYLGRSSEYWSPLHSERSGDFPREPGQRAALSAEEDQVKREWVHF